MFTLPEILVGWQNRKKQPRIKESKAVQYIVLVAGLWKTCQDCALKQMKRNKKWST